MTSNAQTGAAPPGLSKPISSKLHEPDLAMCEGYKLRVEAIRPAPQPGRAVIWPAPDLRGALLTLSSTIAQGVHVHGSAFLVAPGIALTAAHTVADWADAGHFTRPDHAIFAISVSGETMRTWEVRNCVMPAADGDIAILVLAPRFEIPSGTEITHFTLSAAAPAVGTDVFAIGTRLEPADAVLPLAWPDGIQELSIATVSSMGPVREYFLQGLPHIKYPIFAADIFTIGGMSGGPVFDDRGYVVGVISRSFQSVVVEEWMTFVALIWPALTFPFEGVWPPTLFPAGSTLQASAEEGARISRTTDGNLTYTGHISGAIGT